MALILDPIESGINSLLAPFTSVASSTDTSDDDPTISTTATPLSSSVIIITPISDPKTTTSKPTSTGKSTSTHTSSVSTSAKSSTSATTLITSTISSSSSISSDSTSSTTTSTLASSSSSSSSSTASPNPIPPTPFPSAPSAASNANNPPSSSPSSSPAPISTAGIIVAIIFAVGLTVSILWLVARFCPPVRSRIDAWSARRRRERSYREAIDGPAVPAKDTGSATSDHSYSYPYSRSQSQSQSHGRDKHFSFFALGRNPPISTTDSYSRANPEMVVHQQYVSPHSANAPSSRGHGLGLGRVSLLRNHSLLRRAGQDVPPEMPSSSHPAMTMATRPRTRDRNSPLPRLHVDIPESSGIGLVERVSQIGLAVTGTPHFVGAENRNAAGAGPGAGGHSGR